MGNCNSKSNQQENPQNIDPYPNQRCQNPGTQKQFQLDRAKTPVKNKTFTKDTSQVIKTDNVLANNPEITSSKASEMWRVNEKSNDKDRSRLDSGKFSKNISKTLNDVQKINSGMENSFDNEMLNQSKPNEQEKPKNITPIQNQKRQNVVLQTQWQLDPGKSTVQMKPRSEDKSQPTKSENRERNKKDNASSKSSEWQVLVNKSRVKVQWKVESRKVFKEISNNLNEAKKADNAIVGSSCFEPGSKHQATVFYESTTATAASCDIHCFQEPVEAA